MFKLAKCTLVEHFERNLIIKAAYPERSKYELSIFECSFSIETINGIEDTALWFYLNFYERSGKFSVFSISAANHPASEMIVTDNYVISSSLKEISKNNAVIIYSVDLGKYIGDIDDYLTEEEIKYIL